MPWCEPGLYAHVGTRRWQCALSIACVSAESHVVPLLAMPRIQTYCSLPGASSGFARAISPLSVASPKMSDFAAPLRRLDDDVARRALLREIYEHELSGIEELAVPYLGFPHGSSNYIMPVILAEGGAERRDQVRERMAAAGIQTSVHYPAVHRFEAYRSAAAVLPLTEHVADHEFTLPMYATLTADQVSLVCEELRRSL